MSLNPFHTKDSFKRGTQNCKVIAVEHVIIELDLALRCNFEAASFHQASSSSSVKSLQASLQELNEVLLMFTLQIIDLLSVLVHVECCRLRNTDLLR